MPEKSTTDQWFGADVETIREKKVASMLDGFKGVDADVPKTKERVDPETGERRLVREMVRMGAPRRDKMHVVTSGGKNCSDEMARLRNRYKLMRSAFQFAPVGDKDMWEQRMEIAYREMQIRSWQEKLDKYNKTENPRQDQIDVYQSRIDENVGAWTRAMKKGVQ
jgi:hypothetical protein